MSRPDEDAVLAGIWAQRVQAEQHDPMPTVPPVPQHPELLDKQEVAPASTERPKRAAPRRHRTKLKVAAEERPDVDRQRPKTRGECGEERPCPFVSCRHHLYLDVQPRTGVLKITNPKLEVWEMPETCVLDVAGRGGEPGSGMGRGATLGEIGAALNVTRERIRQLETKALLKVQRIDRHRGGALADCAGVNDPGARFRAAARDLEDEDPVELEDQDEDEDGDR